MTIAEKSKLEAILKCFNSLEGYSVHSADLRIFVDSTEKNKNQLEDAGISGSAGARGIEIDMDQEDFYLRWSAHDFLATCHNQYEASKKAFRKPVIIVQEGIMYSADIAESELPLFYRNLLASFEMEEIFENRIADFKDSIKQEFILLSPKAGRESFSYQNRMEAADKFQKFLETGDLHEVAKNLKDKIADPRFVDFFKSAFIERSEKDFFKALMTVAQVCHVADRNLNLYRSGFNIEEFEEPLLDAKNKYFEKYFDLQSKILSKANSFPLQFGIYILLLTRFEEVLLGLLATIVLIIGWCCFSVRSLNHLDEDLDFFARDFEDALERIQEKSKQSFDFKAYLKKFNDRLNRHKSRIDLLRVIAKVFAGVFLAMTVLLIFI